MKTKKILIVTDCITLDVCGRDHFLRELCSSASYFLPFGIHPETFELYNETQLKALPNYHVFDCAAFRESVQQEVRNFFPQFVYNLGREKLHQDKSLLDLLQFGDVNLWWFLEFSEKSALRIPLVNQIYYLGLLATVLEQNEFNEIWINLHDHLLSKQIKLNIKNQKIKSFAPRFKWGLKEMRQILRHHLFLNYFLTVIKEWLSVNLKRLLFAIGNLRQTIDHSVQSCIFSFFPIWWSKPYSTESKESFFGPIEAELREAMPFNYVVWSLIPLKLFAKYLKDLKEIFIAKKIVALECYLKFWDTFEIVSFDLIRKIIQFHTIWSKKICSHFMNFDISYLVVKELESSLASEELFRALLIRRAFKNLTSAGNIKRVLYRHEFQPFEKALLYGSRDHVKRIALQHSLIGRNHLPYFFGEREISEYQSDPNLSAMPLPDFFALAGVYAESIWRKNGFAEDSFSVVGPVRYPALTHLARNCASKESMRKKLGLENDQTIFFFSLTIVWEEVLNLLTLLRKIAPAIEKEENLLMFKCHPSADFEREIHQFMQSLKPSFNYQVLRSDLPALDYIQASDALVSSGSTTCLEALVCDTIPIVFNDQSIFNVNPMLEILDAVIEIKNSEGLREAIQQVKENKSLNSIRKNWSRAIQMAFYRLDQDPVQALIEILGGKGADRTKSLIHEND